MNATLTNLTTNYHHSRAVALAVLRNEADEVISPVGRLADQLMYADRNGITITNAQDVLKTVILTLGFAA